MAGIVTMAVLFTGLGSHLCKLRCVQSDRGRKMLAMFRRGLVTAMVVLFSVVTTTVLSVLRCREVEAHDGSMTWIVASQPRVQCLGDSHLRAFVIAAVTLGVYVLGFPILSTWHVLRVGPEQVADPTSFRSVVWGGFVDGTFQVKYFWFKQVGWRRQRRVVGCAFALVVPELTGTRRFLCSHL